MGSVWRVGVAAVGLLSCGADPGESHPPPITTATVCADPALTWEGFAQPFLTTWCASCHGTDLVGDARHGAPDDLNFGTLAETVPFASLIRSVAVDGLSMPPTNAVPPEDRVRLGDWIACGLPGTDVAPPQITFCSDLRYHDGDVTLGAAPAGACTTWNAVDGDLDFDTTSPLLGCLCEVTGDLTITTADVARLPELVRVGGDLRVDPSASSTLLDAPYLTAVDGTIVVADVSSIERVNFPRLATVGGGIQFARDPALTTVSGMQAVEAVGGHLEFLDLDALLTLNAVPLATTVDGRIAITGNGALTSVWVGDALAINTAGIEIADNPALTYVGGLPQLTSAGKIVLRQLPVLASLPTFLALDTAKGLTISGADQISSLAGFETLRTVNGAVEVSANASLTAVDALDRIGSVDGDFRVIDNPVLPTSGVDALVLAIGVENITGTVDQSGNGPG